MPDTDAVSYASTIQGEHALEADRLRRESRRLREEADALIEKAAWHETRAAWAGQMAEALMKDA